MLVLLFLVDHEDVDGGIVVWEVWEEGEIWNDADLAATMDSRFGFGADSVSSFVVTKAVTTFSSSSVEVSDAG